MNSVYGKELSFLLSPMDEFEGWTHSHLWPLVDEYNPGKMPRKMSMWGALVICPSKLYVRSRVDGIPFRALGIS
jgi:hypothetical protein